MKKRWPLLILAAIVLFLFILGTSYAWYDLFSKEEVFTANLEIAIDDNGKGVVITNAIPLTDEEGKLEEAYRFQVKNSGTGKGTYRLLIQEMPFNQLNDGCTSETLLERSQLRYQLIMNGKEIKSGSLANIKNNILDIRQINVKNLHKYELRIWVGAHAQNTDWQEKHFHYSVVILPTTLEEIK